MGRSATAIAAGVHAAPSDVEVARTIFEAVGRVVVVDEVHLDAVTGLDDQAVQAVKQWLYKPTLLNGEPVEVVTVIDVNFTLSN